MKRKALYFTLIHFVLFTFVSVCNAGDTAGASDKQKLEAKPYSAFKEAPEVKEQLRKFQDKKAEELKKQKEFFDLLRKNGPKQLYSDAAGVAAIDLIPSWEVACVGSCCALICLACIGECLGPEDFPCVIACCIVEDEAAVATCVEACTP